MTRLALRALAGAAVAAAVVLVAPVESGLVLDLYVLFLGALLVVALARAILAAHPGAADSALAEALARPRRPRRRPPDLVRLEDQVALALVTAGDAHLRLRPLLREVAADRLARGHGVDLDAERERARRLLGEDAWALVRPDVDPPADRFGPGVRLERLAAAAAALERL